MPGGGQVHLIVHEHPRTLRGTREIDARDGHVALRVRSYHETVDRLTALGIDHLTHYWNKTPWAWSM